jgi:hypothetical protein
MSLSQRRHPHKPVHQKSWIFSEGHGLRLLSPIASAFQLTRAKPQAVEQTVEAVLLKSETNQSWPF